MNNMNSYPDFSSQGYEIVEQLGANGGRITYKATALETKDFVIVKRFSFENWANFSSYEREIQVLRSLKHPNIPRYIDQFETAKEFCLVREYINAETLSSRGSFQGDEIKDIAISVLDIFVYLQRQKPPIIHRDIKPENILIDEHGKVYLIDFGFARVGDGSVANSSAVAGTFGFMPPEQLYNQQLTKASDLYSLGATLICLLTGKKSHEIGSLVNLRTNRLEFKNRLSGSSLQFIQWLEKMVNPDPDLRYLHAEAALKALQPISMTLIPEVELNTSQLNFRANYLGEKLTQTITVNNPISKTTLQGYWEVAPHRSDPPHTPDNHAWISLFPRELRGNNVNCNITVDTSRLKADKVYERKLILRTNASPEIDIVKVRVQTAALPVERKSISIPYGWLLCLLIASFGLVKLVNLVTPDLYKQLFVNIVLNLMEHELIEGFGLILVALFWGLVAGFILFLLGGLFGFILGLLAAIICGFDYRPWGRNLAILVGLFSAAIGFSFGLICSISDSLDLEPNASNLLTFLPILVFIILAGVIAIVLATISFTNNIQSKPLGVFLSRFTILLGISLGVASWVNFSHPFVIPALAATGLPVITSLLLAPLKQIINIAQYKREIARYRRQEKHLIEP